MRRAGPGAEQWRTTMRNLLILVLGLAGLVVSESSRADQIILQCQILSGAKNTYGKADQVVIDPEKKSEDGREAVNPDNLVCRAVRAVKEQVPGIGIICDVAPTTDCSSASSRPTAIPVSDSQWIRRRHAVAMATTNRGVAYA